MLTLFPDLAPNQTYRFSVSDVHDIYVEEAGNRDGIPIVVMHGGPGLGCGRYLRRFFDSERFRIIMIDQRGAGRSRPLAEVLDNNTNGLISDVEYVRHELGVDKWLVFGYGWGATLALLYAVRHSRSVVGMLLQGVMLGGQKEVDWLFKDGCNRIFPDGWGGLIELLSIEERDDVLGAYSRRLNDSNELIQMQAAKAWAFWIARCSTLHPNQSVVDYYLDPHVAIALARLQCHYFSNLGFQADAEILAGLKCLAGVPGILVHGRYDLISPLSGALNLQCHWNGAEIHIIRDAGHSIVEPAIVDAILNSINQLVDRVGPDIA